MGLALPSRFFLRRCLLATTGACLIAAPVWAQAAPPERLRLTNALARAREQALEVAAAGARQRAAEAQLRQARSYRLPAVELQEMWNRTDSPAEAFAFQLNQERFSFPAFTTSDPNDPEPLNTAMTRLEVSVSVYTGGEISGRIEQARLAAESAERRRASAADGAALAAAEAYVQLEQAREYAALLATSRETVTRHVEVARAFVGQGMIVRSELLRAEVELARLDELLAEARGNARVAEVNLSFRLGADLASTWELEPVAEETAAGRSREEWLALASSRPDLDAARRMLAAGELEAGVRRAALLPRVGLVVRHDLFDDSLFGAHGDSTTVMAMASVDLWNGGRHRAAVAAAHAEAEAGRRDVERMERGIRLEVEQAWEELQTARARRHTAARSLEAAREAERILEERFRSGVAKTLDLLDAATARREAETRELVARAQTRLAAFRLAFKAGQPPEAALGAAGNEEVRP
jgi:outer membrane protein TolC